MKEMGLVPNAVEVCYPIQSFFQKLFWRLLLPSPNPNERDFSTYCVSILIFSYPTETSKTAFGTSSKIQTNHT